MQVMMAAVSEAEATAPEAQKELVQVAHTNKTSNKETIQIITKLIKYNKHSINKPTNKTIK